MGKGKDQSKFLLKGQSKTTQHLLSGESTRQIHNSESPNHSSKGHLGETSLSHLLPGVPECDVILKGNNRFWYLESVLFLFGIIGMIFSAIMLLGYYFNASEYF